MIGSGLLRSRTITNVVSLQNSTIPSVMQAFGSNVFLSVCGVFMALVVDCNYAFILELLSILQIVRC